MRRVLITGILAVVTTTGATGCFLNMYSADPIRRSRQLFNQAEDLRLLEDEMERFWMIDRPSQMSLKRYSGLSDPAADGLRWIPSDVKERWRDEASRESY